MPRLIFIAFAILPCLASAATVQVSVTVDKAHPGAAIPKSFAGFSREWRPFPTPDEGPASAVHPAYLGLIQQLAAFNDEALSIRIGGNSADGMKESPSADRWKQIGEVFKAARTPGIINLNLAREDLELDKTMIRDAQRLLPKEAIATFELGNEPDGWKERYRPANCTYEQYLTAFHTIAKDLVPGLTPGLAGPAWAHAAPPQMLKDFLAAEGPMINLLTVHSYRFDPKSHPEPRKLLAEGATAGFAKSMADGIKVAHDAGLKLRLGEANSAWGGGIPGFSDCFAASLWTLDFFFELAHAGLDGVNLHNSGAQPYSPIKEDFDKQTHKALITANAPFYGMLVFAEAVAHDARFLPVEMSSTSSPLKIWASLDNKGTARIVVINKDLASTGEVESHIAGHRATLKRLTGPSLDALQGITFAGQTFDGTLDGQPVGLRIEETIPMADGVMHLSVPPVSAVLVIVGQ